MIEYQQVAVVNINNGARLETYLINGKRGSGEICLNGAALDSESQVIKSLS